MKFKDIYFLRTKLFAEGIAGLAGIGLDVATVETNIIIFRLTKGNPLTSLVKAHEKGVFVPPNGPDTIRAVTSLSVSRNDIEKAVAIVGALLS